jgi:hypothetical protein
LLENLLDVLPSETSEIVAEVRNDSHRFSLALISGAKAKLVERGGDAKQLVPSNVTISVGVIEMKEDCEV